MLVLKKLVARARELRQRQSRAETEAWEIVRNRRLAGAKFRRQFPIERYVADFACIEARLIVEIDGRSHDSPDQQAHDYGRTTCLQRLGWRVMRIRDDDVLSDPGRVAGRILRELTTPSPLTPLPEGEGK